MIMEKSKINLKYYTVSELIRSSAAQRHSISNVPESDDVWRNLQRLGERVLDPARERLGMPIVVNSGYRSERVNRLVGGARHSQHTKGQAADITCKDNDALLLVLQQMEYDQLIKYLDRYGRIRWIHVSYRESGNRRQQLTKPV